MIFHSYVKLPEGILYYYQIYQANSLEKTVLSGSQVSSFTSARSEIRRWTSKEPTVAGTNWAKMKNGGGPQKMGGSRGFSKKLWLSVLKCYFNVFCMFKTDLFLRWFGGTPILRNHHRLVLCSAFQSCKYVEGIVWAITKAKKIETSMPNASSIQHTLRQSNMAPTIYIV